MDPDLPEEIDFSGGVRGRHGPRQVAALLRYERGVEPQHGNGSSAAGRDALEEGSASAGVSQVRSLGEVTDWSSLVGKFFHAFREDGKIDRQGVILAGLADGYFVVGHFDWISGHRGFYGTRVVHISAIATEGWAFYPSDQTMREAFEFGGRAPRS